MLDIELNVANVLDIMTMTLTMNSLLVASLNVSVQAIQHVTSIANLIVKG